MSELNHFVIGTNPGTGKPWAYCLKCGTGNGATVEMLREACARNCGVTLYDADGMPFVAQPQEEDEN